MDGTTWRKTGKSCTAREHKYAASLEHPFQVKPWFQLIQYSLCNTKAAKSKRKYVSIHALHDTFLSFSIISSMTMSPFWETLLSICVSHSQSSLFFSLKTAHSFSFSLTCCRRKETLKYSEKKSKWILETVEAHCASVWTPLDLQMNWRRLLPLKKTGFVLQKLCMILWEFRGKCYSRDFHSSIA